MTTNTNAALPDIPAAGAKALSDYLKDCEANAIQPDIGGAFAYAFMAGAALTTAAAVPPEGWVMVPVEPTEEMKAAAVKYANGPAVYKNVRAEVLRIEEGIYGEVYEAMLAAAPKAEPLNLKCKATQKRLATLWGFVHAEAQAAPAAQGDAEQSKLIQQMLAALETCRESGYVDVDGDWQMTQHFDRAAVDAAIDAARSQAKEGGA